MTDPFEPNIVGFLCNWCSYEGADGAGRARLAVPSNLKVVRVMCSGRTDPQFVMESFTGGADGVLILGCPPGSCHYKVGNIEALKSVTLLKKVLEPFGIAEARLKIDWVSSNEGEKFVQIVTEMVENIRRIGPLGR